MIQIISTLISAIFFTFVLIFTFIITLTESVTNRRNTKFGIHIVLTILVSILWGIFYYLTHK